MIINDDDYINSRIVINLDTGPIHKLIESFLLERSIDDIRHVHCIAIISASGLDLFFLQFYFDARYYIARLKVFKIASFYCFYYLILFI